MSFMNYSLPILFIALVCTACGRNIRTAEDVTPGHMKETCLDWKYGATDIRIQTEKVTDTLMQRWWNVAKGDLPSKGKARIMITEVDNRTDQYISKDMIRDIIEEVAIDDGRFTITVGDMKDSEELDQLLKKVGTDSKYRSSTQPELHQVTAPQFTAKIRLTKAITHQRRYDLEHYRFSITLYDLQTQEAIDSASDTLYKKVKN
jgi:hypothetical protein